MNREPSPTRAEQDLGETFRAMRDAKKERHARWSIENRETLEAQMAGRYIDKGEAILFREPGKPAVDFYPSTGRWRAFGKMHKGGAQAFIFWYQNRQGGK